MLRYLSIIMIVLALAACGAEDETNDEEAANDTPTEAAETSEAEEASTDEDPVFVLSVTGAETFDFEAEPVFGCAEDEMTLQTFTQSPRLLISLPANIEAGTYPLADFDASSAQSYVEGSAVVSIVGEIIPGIGRGNTYFSNAEGELVIETIPAAPGELFVGSLNGQLTDSDDATISFSADFDFMTNSFNFLDCQFAE